jgi:O-glycosyl hydrolase
MPKHRLFIVSIFMFFAISSMANDSSYIINTSSSQQTIEHFGASDAWSMFALGLWREEQRNQIADWLFSMKTDEQGQPLGIGLSLWRFNLGAGSAEQGDSSQINKGTRTECMLCKDGSYDYSKQMGQRNFLKLAKERGVPYILAFCNSAPVYFTKNGLATNTGRGGTINLRDDCYDDFAKYLVTAVKGIEQHDGVKIDYISPVNEHDGNWNWTGPKQEGSPATNREVAHLTKELSKQLLKSKMDTKILIDESSDLRSVLFNHNTSWQRGKAWQTFFRKDSVKTYLGNLPNVLPVIAGHSYWTDTPTTFLRSMREQLRDSLKLTNTKYWMSELCIMSNDTEIGGGKGYDFSMPTALYVARIIHHDLVFGNACSWSWWRAVCGGDYRDALIRVFSHDGMATGWAADSKLLWAIGNYSRFIRPGAVRYDVTAEDTSTDPTGVMCSAFKNKDGRWAVVVINYSKDIKSFILSLSNGEEHSWRMYRTSNITSENISPIGTTTGPTLLAPLSITTFVSER